MKETEKYTVKEAVEKLQRKIRFLERKMLKEKLGATVKDGGYNYYFMVMENLTRELLMLTKPVEKFDSPIYQPIDSM